MHRSTEGRCQGLGRSSNTTSQLIGQPAADTGLDMLTISTHHTYKPKRTALFAAIRAAIAAESASVTLTDNFRPGVVPSIPGQGWQATREAEAANPYRCGSRSHHNKFIPRHDVPSPAATASAAASSALTHSSALHAMSGEAQKPKQNVSAVHKCAGGNRWKTNNDQTS